MVITIGPLQITSMSKDWSEWGSFEILWADQWYFYCHFLQECDPYNGKTFGVGEAQWVLHNMKTKRDIWCLTAQTYKVKNWWNRVRNRLHGT